MILFKYLMLLILAGFVFVSLRDMITPFRDLFKGVTYENCSDATTELFSRQLDAGEIAMNNIVVALITNALNYLVPLCFYLNGYILVTEVYVAFLILEDGMFLKRYLDNDELYQCKVIHRAMSDGTNKKAMSKALFVTGILNVIYLVFIVIPLIAFVLSAQF